MATTLAVMVILGLLAGRLFETMRLPALLGMIILGALIGPYGMNILHPDMIQISGQLRTIALIVILLRAGLGIEKENIKMVGKAAIRLSIIPGLLEGLTITFLATQFFDFSWIQGGILGFIIAASSPAVIVPAMLNLMEQGLGEDKHIPTMILAGASIDDVFAITIFSAFLGMYGGSEINLALKIASIPLSIILGLLSGVLIAGLLIKLFKKYEIFITYKTLVVLSSAILLTAFEEFLESWIDIAGLLGVMAIGFVLFEKMPQIGAQLSSQFNHIWAFAQILLFVLVGAQVNIPLALKAGLPGLALIILGLLARSLGVLISLIGTNLNQKERLFSVLAYLPKATVQAAIGALPLSMGVASGDLILSLAVLSIVLTAPLGAIAIEVSADKLLS